jgi:hypothetical protein
MPVWLQCFKETFYAVLESAPKAERDATWEALTKAIIAVLKAFSEKNIVDSLYGVFGRPQKDAAEQVFQFYEADIAHMLQVNPFFATLFKNNTVAETSIIEVVKTSASEMWVADGRMDDTAMRSLLEEYIEFPDEIAVLQSVCC